MGKKSKAKKSGKKTKKAPQPMVNKGPKKKT
jgi:hypothetical protein